MIRYIQVQLLTIHVKLLHWRRLCIYHSIFLADWIDKIVIHRFIFELNYMDLHGYTHERFIYRCKWWCSEVCPKDNTKNFMVGNFFVYIQKTQNIRKYQSFILATQAESWNIFFRLLCMLHKTEGLTFFILVFLTTRLVLDLMLYN